MADPPHHGGPAGKQPSDDVPSSYGTVGSAAAGSSGGSSLLHKGDSSAKLALASLTSDLQRLTGRGQSASAGGWSAASGSDSRGAVVIDDDDDDDDEVIGWTEDSDNVVLVEGDKAGRSTGRAKGKVPVDDGAGAGAVIIESWSEIAFTFQCKHCTLINNREAGQPLRTCWTCHACGKPRWELGEDEDHDDPDYAPDDVEDDSLEDDDDMEDDEVQHEVAALKLEQYMSIEGVLERLNIPIDELLALYGKEELTDEVEDDGADQEDGGEGESSARNQLIPYYPSLKYAVPEPVERYVAWRTAPRAPSAVTHVSTQSSPLLRP